MKVLLNLLFIYFSLCTLAKFLMSFLKAQVTFPLKFASILSTIRHNPTVLFYLKHYILGSKEPIKEHFFLDFWVLESKFIKFLMSILEWLVNSSSNFALFLIVMTNNFSANFKVISLLLWTKGSHQSLNFDTFKWSGENLPTFSSLFSNHKSIPLQILHPPSVSWKITPTYFFRSNNIYFAQKECIKVKIFEKCA